MTGGGRLLRRVLVAAGSGLLASGCGAAGPIPVQQPAAPVRERASLDSLVTQARADAARRTGAAPQAIETVSAESVTWPDGSIGCAQPGVMYTMALVPGYRIRLRVQGKLLSYHASARGAMLLCPEGMGAEPVPDASR